MASTVEAGVPEEDPLSLSGLSAYQWDSLYHHRITYIPMRHRPVGGNR